MEKRYKISDLAEILEEMKSYIEQYEDVEEIEGYFQEITSTGLFEDSCGKCIREGHDIICVDEY